MMLLPSGKTVNSNTPVYPGSNFTWGEVTKNCSRHLCDLVINGRTIINKFEIEQKIVETAKKLDRIRKKLGDRPIHVNSWYRPPGVNANVGGSKYSRHLFGDGVDIRSDYFTPAQIWKLIEPDHHSGGLGKYFSFIHIDWRGTKARWRG